MCGYVCNNCGKCKEARVNGVYLPCIHCGAMNPLGMTACASCGQDISIAPPGGRMPMHSRH